MEIFFLLSIIILVNVFIVNKFFHSAKRNLFKNQAAWSGKDLKIKYRNTNNISESERNDNFLKIIADESKFYLEDQLKKEDQ